MKSLELFKKDNYPEKIKLIEQFYSEKASELNKFSFVKNIRYLGSVFAFEIDSGDRGYLNPIGLKIRELALEKGVLLRPLGNQIYITPPYIIQKSSLERIFTTLEYILERIF